MKAVRHLVPALALLLLPTLGFTTWDPGDPPARVGRLSFIAGTVSFRPASVDEWGDASVNYPLTAGDALWADDGSRAEVTLGATALRLAPYTGIEFLALDDSTAQIHLSEGSLQVRVRTLAPGEFIEISTPNGAVTLLRPGSYRVDTDSSGEQTTVTVRMGEAEVAAGGRVFTVRRMQSATLSGIDEPSYDIAAAPALDPWDQWCAARDRRADNARSVRYVSRDMPGYEDLDDYGDWRATDAYGPVWTPRRVAAGWAPYRYGHWSWVDPWGWTWIDDASWGFAPFHYGRWVYVRGAWGWVPGRLVAVRPVYAPALVVFLGGAEVSWFPLAPGEVYVPAYHVSRTYARNVNVTTVNVTNLNITTINMTRVRYANRAAPRGVTVVARETFLGARPVGREAVDVPRNRSLLGTVVGTAPQVAPTRESVMPRREAPGQRPPEGLFTRRVVVNRTPPPAPVPFSVRERALQDHPGRPVDAATLDTLRGRAPAPDRERQVQPARGSAPGGSTPPMRPMRRQPIETRPAPAITPPREPAAPPVRQAPPAQPAQPPPAPTPERRRGDRPVTPPRPAPMPPQAQPAQPAQPVPPAPPVQPPQPQPAPTPEQRRGEHPVTPPRPAPMPPQAQPAPSAQPPQPQPAPTPEQRRGERAVTPPRPAPPPAPPAAAPAPERGKRDTTSGDASSRARRQPARATSESDTADASRGKRSRP
jgi:hypothetical protein